jgi:hypothetical protein
MQPQPLGNRVRQLPFILNYQYAQSGVRGVMVIRGIVQSLAEKMLGRR